MTPIELVESTSSGKLGSKLTNKINELVARVNELSGKVEELNGRHFIANGSTVTISPNLIATGTKEQTLHTWSEAYAHMKQGGKVRRANWGEGYYIHCPYSLFKVSDGADYLLQTSELDATDWVLL